MATEQPKTKPNLLEVQRLDRQDQHPEPPEVEEIKEAEPQPTEGEGLSRYTPPSQDQPASPPPAAQPAPVAPPAKNERRARIENILEEGLEEYFFSLPSQEQQMFKAAGEKTAAKIEQLITSAKAKVVKIVEIIKSWLKVIPGLSKWFIEQEAKIKADRIMQAEHEQDK